MLVEAGPANSFLHCDVNSPCSLAVVPNWGGEQPGTGVGGNFANHSFDTVPAPGQTAGFADDTYIGRPCSWADRIRVPLSFSKTPSDCAANAPAIPSAGSPLL